MRRALVFMTLLAACGVGTPDSRVTGTLYTSMCDWNESQWLGVERVRVAIEYAPGNLADRSLPTQIGSCSLDTTLFPEESRFDGGEDLPKLDGSPRWASIEESGALTEETAGLWTGGASLAGGCTTVDDVAATGLKLESAGDLDGISTPPPGDPGLVYIDGELEHDWSGVVQRDSPLPLSWDGAGWDETFVQIRQINGETVRQTLTCNTTGLTAFRVDNSIWGQLDNVGAEQVQVYVGFQNVDKLRQKGETVEVVTRLVHVVQTDD